MKKRLLSAFFAIAITLPSILYSPLAVKAIVLFAAGLCLFEFLKMTLGGVKHSVAAFGTFLGLLLCGSLIFIPPLPVILLLISFLMTGFVYLMISEKNLEKIPQTLAYLIFSQIYIVLPLVHFAILRDQKDGDYFVLWILVSTFMGDSVAYFFGRYLGKHKMAPRISPKKTWEGFIGQICGALIGSLVIWHLCFQRKLAFQHVIVVSLICAFFGALGDLSESLIKRGFGVKDSGNLMPGHGGLLDRIDGLLFSGPVVFYYLYYFVV